MRNNIIKLTKDLRKGAKKHSTEILTGIAMAGYISAGVWGVLTTPKAIDDIKKAKKKKGEELTKVEKVKTAGKYYIGPIILTGLSSACLLQANNINKKRYAALATAYKLSETALTDYKDKVVEVLGEKKEKEIKDKIAKDKAENISIKPNELVVTEPGKATLCYDAATGVKFWSDMEAIRKAVNNINFRLMSNMYVSLNELYYELGIEDQFGQIGEDIGWNIDNGPIEVEFSSQLTKEGRPCLVLNYRVFPRYDYTNLH